MPNRSLEGILPALVTPFREDERIDYDAWQTIIDVLIGAGVHGLFCGGSQGEFYSLDMEERQVALRFCKQAAAGRVPIYGNVGCITTRDTIKLALQAEEVGIDYLVVITPYYIKPTQDELAAHYIEVCRSVRTPVLAYNFPLHGGVELMPGTVARIAARCPNLAGLKDSSGKLAQAVAYKAAVPDREFAVFIGFDNLILAALEQGCAGAVAATANVAPRLLIDLYRAFREGNLAEAARLQALADELGGLLLSHTFPAVMKEAVGMAGLPAGPCRRPVGPMPAEPRARLAQVLARLEKEGYLPKLPRTVVA